MVGMCIMGLQNPSPSGYALWVMDFIIYDALPTMQYIIPDQ